MGLYHALKTFCRKAFIKSLARPSLEVAVLHPRGSILPAMRWLNSILLPPEQLQAIAEAIKGQSPCRVLVFGVGYDSPYWSKLNHGGTTLFLEDDEKWLGEITRRYPYLRALPVRYDSQRRNWQRHLTQPDLNRMDLPPEVEQGPWDLILVDGPAGWDDEATPGRMKSIYQAARLVKASGQVFVHDCNRAVEANFSDRFLGRENLVRELRSREGFLRHYQMERPPPGKAVPVSSGDIS